MTEVSNWPSWDELHRKQRHQLAYPAEPVIRFLVASCLPGDAVLDVGCGTGRHMRLARELGLNPVGVDFSPAAIQQARQYGYTVEAEMTQLPFSDNEFDAAVAFGSLYYGTSAQTQQALDEIRRILRPGGKGFISVKTRADWRYAKGRLTDDGSAYQLQIPGEPEDGMTLNFVSEVELRLMCGGFSDCAVERAEWTEAGMHRLNSDWWTTVTK